MKKTWKLVSLISIMVFNIGSLAAGTAAWFYATNTKSVKLSSIKVMDPNDFTISTPKVLYWDKQQDCGRLGDISQLALDPYDTFISYRNETNERYLYTKITFKQYYDTSYRLYVVARSTVTTTKPESYYVVDAKGKDCVRKQISNVIQLRTYNYSTSISPDETGGTIYTKAYNKIKAKFKSSGSTTKTFVTASKATSTAAVRTVAATKTDYCIPYKTLYTTVGPETSSGQAKKTSLYMYVELNYNYNLTEYLYQHYEGKEETELKEFENPKVELTQDIYEFNIYVSKTTPKL